MKVTALTRTRTRIALLTAGVAVLVATALSAPALAEHSQPLQAVSTLQAVNSVQAADPASSPDPGTTYPSGGWCHYRNWGGSFYCDSQVKYKLPNGYYQVFVIGTDREVFSRWHTSSGTSGWLNMGGQCISPGHHSVDIYKPNGWAFSIACVGTNGRDYRRDRDVHGNWSAWRGPFDLW